MEQIKTADLCRQFIDCMEVKYKLKAEATENEKKLRRLNAQLYERFDEEGLQELVVENVKLIKKSDETFSLDGEAKGQEWNQPEGAVLSWIKEIGEKDLIKDNIHQSTMKAFLKEWRKDKKDLPPFIKVGFYNHIKTNKSEIARRVKNDAES